MFIYIYVAGGDSGGLSMLLDVQQLQLDSSSEKSRTSSLLSTSLSSKFPKLGGINNVLSNAGTYACQHQTLFVVVTDSNAPILYELV